MIRTYNLYSFHFCDYLKKIWNICSSLNYRLGSCLRPRWKPFLWSFSVLLLQHGVRKISHVAFSGNHNELMKKTPPELEVALLSPDSMCMSDHKNRDAAQITTKMIIDTTKMIFNKITTKMIINTNNDEDDNQ